MSSHGPIINEEGLRGLGRNVSRITQGVLLVVGIVSTVFSLAGEYSHGEHYLENWLVVNVSIMGAVLHLVLVLLILFPGRLHRQNDDVKDHTVRSVTQALNNFFIPAWTWVWVFFGLLYAVFFFGTMRAEQTHAIRLDHTSYAATIRQDAMMDGFNVGSTLFIAAIFYFLTPSFLRGYVRRCRNEPERRSGVRRTLRRIAASSSPKLRSAAEELHVWPPERRNSWLAHRWFVLLVIGASAASAGLVYMRANILGLSWLQPIHAEKLIALVLGCSSAMALAAFSGRVDTQFIRRWQWVIPLLFLYALLQPYTGVLYEDVRIHRAVFTYAAFTLKCLLFIFVSNFFEGRKAVYYAYEIVDTADKRAL